LWRRRPAGDFVTHGERKIRRRDAGATKTILIQHWGAKILNF
jgi:hypothetical protein